MFRAPKDSTGEVDAHGKMVQFFKTSKAGKLKLVLTEEGYKTVRKEGMPEYEDQLVPVFMNGELVNRVTFEEIKERVMLRKEVETV